MTGNSPVPTVPLWQDAIASSLATLSYPFLVACLLVIAFLAAGVDSDLGELWKQTRKWYLRTLFGIELTPIEAAPPGADLSVRSHRNLVGKLGIAATPLKLAGEVCVDGRRFAAISVHGFVEKGAQVKVISDDGKQLGVARE